jgi:hypothetical protein
MYAKAVADTSYIVLDVRTPAEHDTGGIANVGFAIFIPFSKGTHL